MLIIVIDYDGTVTADWNLWKYFIRRAKKGGHTIVGITMRRPDETDAAVGQFIAQCDQVLFTSRKAKRRVLMDAGINPDIWIDNDPVSIFEDYS